MVGGKLAVSAILGLDLENPVEYEWGHPGPPHGLIAFVSPRLPGGGLRGRPGVGPCRPEPGIKERKPT